MLLLLSFDLRRFLTERLVTTGNKVISKKVKIVRYMYIGSDMNYNVFSFNIMFYKTSCVFIYLAFGYEKHHFS